MKRPGDGKEMNGAAYFDRRSAAVFVGAAAAHSTWFPAAASVSATAPFLVYYGTEDDPALGTFRLAVLDAEADAALLARRRPGASFLGYVSLCEVHRDRRHYATAQAAGLLLGPNPSWPDAAFVDIRSPLWAALVCDEIIPAILARGFDGVFLDTLDDAEHLERLDPQRFAGMIPAAIALVRQIRRRMPQQPIMVNRGYALLPALAGTFDMLLGESVRARHDGERGGYALTSDEDYRWQRERMWEARNRDPALQLFSLDYWEPDDRQGVALLHAEQRRNGFVPYVATRDLARILPPPMPEAP